MLLEAHIEESSGVVRITGTDSQSAALELCGRLQKRGLRTTLGTLFALPGYQVLAYQASIQEVSGILGQLGIASQKRH